MYPTTNTIMSLIKTYILLNEEQEEYLWESYLEFIEDNKELLEQLPLSLQEEEEQL